MKENVLVAEFREQGGSRGQWWDEAGEVGMMLGPLRPLEFMVSGSDQSSDPGVEKKRFNFCWPSSCWA